MQKLLLSLPATFILLSVAAQQPAYTEKHFVREEDPKEFVPIVPKSGFTRTYLLGQVGIMDLDDNHTTYIKYGTKALLCIEGEYQNNQREGVFTFSLIDSLDHKKRYKLYEQTFKANKLNGEWRTYTLAGKLNNVQHYSNDSLDGLSRTYWIDGKSIVEERQYSNGRANYILRKYSPPDTLEREITFVNNAPNGAAKVFYPSGIVKDEVTLKDGALIGIRRYYYPSGKIWSEAEYKNGKPWTAIANYTADGQKRNPGTLKNGNGTMILYDDDGTVRQTLRFIEGVQL
ncbi:toxin-antitoxin system YwqK family antitoxin [Puia dinghuensis]|uniref:Toxin-antitoxin system YwqK family antitoxin n=1 Tax=Puia dinghuensis TaxID=1792502 RepID=A0A8J2UIW9_9BACT|nr:toxin-antitoxin system YwqK family antitoxin [Puia dinghuensis]GGB24356.1 hypothetical protein GCM10011511_55330 [Puia dinghuensis]